MKKVFLLLVTSLAVIHVGTAANTNRTHDEISFVDDADESSDALREKIKTDYKRIKDMIMKNKTLSPITITEKAAEVSVLTEATTVTDESTTEASTEASSTTNVDISSTTSESTETSSATTENSIEKSSTIESVEIDAEKPENETENPPTVSNNEESTLPESANLTRPTHLDDRFIINAPVMCKDGRVADQSGKCRKIVSFV